MRRPSAEPARGSGQAAPAAAGRPGITAIWRWLSLIAIVSAAALLTWLAGRNPHPARALVRLIAVLLLLSLIPDLGLFRHSSTGAGPSAALALMSLHLVAALVIVPSLLAVARRRSHRERS